MKLPPVAIVLVTSTSYASASLALTRTRWMGDARTNLKAVSSFHALATCAAVLYTLSRPWTISSSRDWHPSPVASSKTLDDSQNPMIQGHSYLGNAITGWETGYLLYDTAALLILHPQDRVVLAHHILLFGALGYLQIYITREQERGIWIILSFLLMNASNPLLHFRWWRRKRSGQPSVKMDVLFAAVFAVCRFGTVYYILAKYSAFHHLSTWQAFARQRAVCKVGTSSLLILNAAWWLRLVKSISRSFIANR